MALPAPLYSFDISQTRRLTPASRVRRSMAAVLQEIPEQTAQWEEDHWNVLLAQIEEGSVIPIIGPNLLQVRVDGQEMLLDRFLAGQLARRFSLPHDPDLSLNDMVCMLLHSGRQREILASAVHNILSS